MELKFALQDLGEECKKLQAEVATKRERIIELENRKLFWAIPLKFSSLC